MEDCATSMSASQGCIDDKAVVEFERSFRDALKGRIGEDRYRMWFSQGVDFEFDRDVEADAQCDLLDKAIRECDARSEVENQITDNSCAIDDPRDVTATPTGSIQRVRVRVRGQFALDRIRQHFMAPLRGAAMHVCGQPIEVDLQLVQSPASQSTLPLGDVSGKGSNQELRDEQAVSASTRKRSVRRSTQRSGQRRGPKPLSQLVTTSTGRDEPGAVSRPGYNAPRSVRGTAARSEQLRFPDLDVESSAERDHGSALAAAGADEVKGRGGATAASLFIAGSSNKLAHTAMAMVCQDPKTASPLFLCGPTGTGKTHLLTAIAEQFRRRHRMRRVMQLSAEQFTNDFVTSVGNSGITAFRRRYREVDALLVDDVQFLGAKKATLREMLYTVETLSSAGRPLVFSGLTAPTEIRGLSGELSGRMAAGLVCSIQPLDTETRGALLRRWIEERCQQALPDEMIEQINCTLAGDGRVLSGVVNVLNTLQRMNGRNPTMDELRRYAGQLLRSAPPVTNLSVIEAAVCETFQLEPQTLRGGSQTRAVTEPRMLAMYLSREMTSAAYSEIARHFGGKSHSTAISANNNVKNWLESGKAIGRGPAAMSVQEAIDRVEGLLRSG